jgi:hypothetical protein
VGDDRSRSCDRSSDVNTAGAPRSARPGTGSVGRPSGRSVPSASRFTARGSSSMRCRGVLLVRGTACRALHCGVREPQVLPEGPPSRVDRRCRSPCPLLSVDGILGRERASRRVSSGRRPSTASTLVDVILGSLHDLGDHGGLGVRVVIHRRPASLCQPPLRRLVERSVALAAAEPASPRLPAPTRFVRGGSRTGQPSSGRGPRSRSRRLHDLRCARPSTAVSDPRASRRSYAASRSRDPGTTWRDEALARSTRPIGG